ncbi:MAG: XTP/dITP diphosphatase [bacterium]
MQLVLATNNKGKIREIKQLLEDLPVTILTADDFLEFPDVEETGKTFAENALLKANAIAEFCNLPALADDSGLEVDALGGAPGVYSARYAGEDGNAVKNNDKLIRELKDIPKEKRTARFKCVIAINWGDGTTDTIEGSVEGVIAEDIAVGNGFGYDPVFYYPPAKKRFAEMTTEEKNTVSHRGKALQKARELIMERLGK